MEYHALGESGLRVPPFALGSWLTLGRLEEGRAAELVALVLDHGVNFFDTADVYDHGAAEEAIGGLLRGRNRAHLVLASKAFFPMSEDPNDLGLSRKHLFESVHGSLGRLGTDYLDLYQCHRADPDTPLAETVRALGDLILQGKILYWGTSMWPAERIRAACRIADELGVPRPISEQARYNMLCRELETEVLPACRECGLGLLFWSPLAQGFLSGKYGRGAPPPPGSRGADPERFVGSLDRLRESEVAFDRLERVAALAAKAGIPLPVLAISWCLRQIPGSTVLLGATRPEQLRETLSAAELEWPKGLDAALEQALAGPLLRL